MQFERILAAFKVKFVTSTALLALAISMVSAAPSSATSTDVSLFISAPYVQGSHVIGDDVLRESFDSLSTCTGQTAVGLMSRVATNPSFVCSISNVEGHGGASVNPDVYTPLVGSGIGSKFATNGEDEVTINLTNPVKYVGLWWSAGNNPNVISFYDDSTLIQTMTADDLITMLSGPGSVNSLGSASYLKSSYLGNPRNTSLTPLHPFAYLNLFLSGDVSVNKIVVSGYGFEFDNLVTKESAAAPLESMVFVSSSSGTTPDFQTVTWNPTNTSVAQTSGSVTPNQLASVTTPASGGGAITYSVVDADTSGCSVDSPTGVITHTSIGNCVVRATAAAVSGTTNYFASYKDATFTFTTPTLTCPVLVPYLANNASTTLISGVQVTVTNSTIATLGTDPSLGYYFPSAETGNMDGTFNFSETVTKFGFEALYNDDAPGSDVEIMTWTAKNAAGETVDSPYTITNRNTTEIETYTFSEPISKIEFKFFPRSGNFASAFKLHTYADAAYCASATTTVTYDAGDGSVSPTSAEWSEGDDPLTLPTPTRDGYHFAGWFDADTDGTLIGEAGDEYTPESDVTLYAQWQILCESTTTTNGRENIVTFNYTGECYWEVPSGITEVEYLVVAGGGGGGGGSVRNAVCSTNDGGGLNTRRGGGGGGGAGGTVIEGSISVASSDVFRVVIGEGGTAGTGGTCPTGGSGMAGTAGADGADSVFGSHVASGGAGGDGGRATGAGGNGGSNAFFSGGTQSIGAIDCPSTSTVGCFAAAGGAGAGSAGESIDPTSPVSENGGNGGIGVISEITGLTYGGGGGGGNRHPDSAPVSSRAGGAGGSGGGGNGNAVGHGYSGTEGLGAGGGGGRGNGSDAPNNSNTGSGGAGGDGTVVLRYFTPLEGFIVSFDSRGGSPDPESIEWEDGSGPITLPSVTLDGFSLRGWFTPTGFFVGKPGDLFTPTESIQLEAKWRFIYPDPTPPVDTNPNQVPAPVIEVTSNNGGSATVITKDPSGLSFTTKITDVSKDIAVKYENGVVRILDESFVGTLTVTLTSTNSAGSSVSKTITLTVNPNKPDTIEAFFTSAWNNLRLDTIIATRTKIVWSETPGAIAYEVLLDGKVIGSTSDTEFVIASVLNPKKRLKVRSIGPDNTKSTPRRVQLTDELMQIARVNFAPASAKLTAASKKVLDKLVQRIIKQKLRVIDLRGYTDNQGGEDGAIELSKARALAVRAYLRAALSGQRVWVKQSWYGNANPAMPNDTEYGLALNRRVDIYVGK